MNNWLSGSVQQRQFANLVFWISRTGLPVGSRILQVETGLPLCLTGWPNESRMLPKCNSNPGFWIYITGYPIKSSEGHMQIRLAGFHNQFIWIVPVSTKTKSCFPDYITDCPVLSRKRDNKRGLSVFQSGFQEYDSENIGNLLDLYYTTPF